MDFGIFQENASKPINLKFGVKQILRYEYRTLVEKLFAKGFVDIVGLFDAMPPNETLKT